MNALQRLLAVLLSSAGGLDLLLHNAVAMGALLKALDPKADPYGPVFASDSQPSRQALSQQARRGNHDIVCDSQQGAHRGSWSRVLYLAPVCSKERVHMGLSTVTCPLMRCHTAA